MWAHEEYGLECEDHQKHIAKLLLKLKQYSWSTHNKSHTFLNNALNHAFMLNP